MISFDFLTDSEEFPVARLHCGGGRRGSLWLQHNSDYNHQFSITNTDLLAEEKIEKLNYEPTRPIFSIGFTFDAIEKCDEFQSFLARNSKDINQDSPIQVVLADNSTNRLIEIKY